MTDNDVRGKALGAAGMYNEGILESFGVTVRGNSGGGDLVVAKATNFSIAGVTSRVTVRSSQLGAVINSDGGVLILKRTEISSMSNTGTLIGGGSVLARTFPKSRARKVVPAGRARKEKQLANLSAPLRGLLHPSSRSRPPKKLFFCNTCEQ